MVRPGDELIDPIRGQRLIFRRTAQGTNGELVEVEAFYQPTSVAPPAHLHPQQEECFEVLSGSITVRLNGQENRYHAGETFCIPAGIAHEMWNGSKAETHLRWQTRPALHTDAFFEIMWRLAEAGKTKKTGVPNLLQLAVIMRQYRQEFRPVKPPLLVQHIVFALLAPLGRLCGYRATWTRKGD
jgi:quercetin dioxygenase-like cupin family protein